ncbi:MAG: hypothetical protein KJ571_11645 [Bacteroidetes bacterium]|nr:hypothetical protein [Bacteroidota bacterium]
MSLSKNNFLTLSAIMISCFILAFFNTVSADSFYNNSDSTKYKTIDRNNNDSLFINESGTNNKSWNEVCPVLGFKVDPKQETILFEDKLYGFCCKDCPRKFSKNSVGYSLNLHEDGKKFIGKKGLPQKLKQ